MNCFTPAKILIPKNINEKWPVIACDQYTSEPEYWENVKSETVGFNTSLNMILPECYLKPDNTERINAINKNMEKALEDDIFDAYDNSFVYVERTQSDGKVRKGIVGKIDLEEYDYLPNTTALVRATEKTVISRIPPRVKIREDAPLELPHIMLLIDDKDNSVIGSLTGNTENLSCLYDINLMKNGGRVKGYLVSDGMADNVSESLDELKEKSNGLLFCVGDGNHSLATAKECYNKNKTEKSRYALVEVVNIHDEALEFEPIYRVIFDSDGEKLISDFVSFCGGEYSGEDAQKFTCIIGNEIKEISVKPKFKLPVATLQSFLDEYLSDQSKIDYIHGENSLKKICADKNALGFIFDGMKKDELFEAVRLDGSLPRKTFSMGNADDKRFYLEARKIK